MPMRIMETKAQAYGMTVNSWEFTAEKPKDLTMLGRKAPVDASIKALVALVKEKNQVLVSLRLERICQLSNMESGLFDCANC